MQCGLTVDFYPGKGVEYVIPTQINGVPAKLFIKDGCTSIQHRPPVTDDMGLFAVPTEFLIPFQDLNLVELISSFRQLSLVRKEIDSHLALVKRHEDKLTEEIANLTAIISEKDSVILSLKASIKNLELPPDLRELVQALGHLFV